MKRRIKIILSCIITVCLTVGLLSYLTDLMERKSSDFKYADFFEQQEDFDVLFMGTSHVINAIFPMELWNDYGIVSYNFGGHGNQIATTYWVIENALEYTTPKLIVVDCYFLEQNIKYSNTFSNVHLSLDAFPLSITKFQAILDLLDDPFMDEGIKNGTISVGAEQPTKIGLLWDYSVYHSRWTELTDDDFNPSSSYEKGAESRIAVTRNELNLIDKSQKMDSGTTGEKYLRKIIEDCQNRGIDVLLTYIPFPATESQQMTANYCYDIANEYGVNYINFLDFDLIDYQTDLYDSNSHLNPSGARKVTDYLGKYIKEHYDIDDQRTNSAYSEWYTDYDEYIDYKNANLMKQEDLVTYLMLLSGDKLDAAIDIRDKDILKSQWILDQLNNLGVDISLITDSTDFIIIKDGGTQAVSLDNFRESGTSANTAIGDIKIFCNDSGEIYGLYVDGEEYMTGTTDDESSMHIRVKRDDETFDDVRFSYTVNPDDANDITILSIDRTE